MEQRELGTSGLKVSAMGLGCMGMSEFYGESDQEASIATLHHALDRGVNFWDTADAYGSGKNEELISKVLAERRNEVTLATKFGYIRGEGGAFLGLSGRPEHVKAACDASLARLGTDHIDLYYQHRVDPEVPIEDTVGAMAELVAAGKVLHLGLSEAAPETIRRAHQVHSIAALQTEYSLFTRDLEAEILPTLRELGIGLVPYSPLGRGLLSGQIRSLEDLDENDYRRTSPRFQGDNFKKNLDLVDHLQALAEKRGCTPSQLALAWVLEQGQDISPIPGTRHQARIDENSAAVEIRLSAEELAEIDRILPPDSVAGTRYPEASMRVVNG